MCHRVMRIKAQYRVCFCYCNGCVCFFFVHLCRSNLPHFISAKHTNESTHTYTQSPVHRRPNSEEIVVVDTAGERVQHKIGSYHIIYINSSECNEVKLR